MGQENFSFSAPEEGPARRPKRPAAADELRGSGARRAAARPAREEEAPAFTVSQLTREIEARLVALGRIRVEGEVAGIRRAASGHVYFDLKEEGALVSCVVWRGAASRAIPKAFEEGMQALVRGKLDVYGPHGRYKLIVDRVEPLGLGALLARLEALKEELRGLGMLDRARPLPRFPRRIGVVTSRDGAALRDFLRTRSLRWPLYPVRLAHTLVQGPGAEQEIADAIDRLDASGVDLIVVTRGGGSLQDLWCFNERVVAEAIWRASVPVVSAVGHETDTSLADLVADHRAHTPTDAAQTVIPDRAAVFAELERLGNRLIEAAHEAVGEREEALARAARSRGLADPSALLEERAGRLREARSRLELSVRRSLDGAERRARSAGMTLERESPARRLAVAHARVELLFERLSALGQTGITRAGQRLELVARSLEAISPLAVLGRGYSITSRADEAGSPREALLDAGRLNAGDLVHTRLSRGAVTSRVVDVVPPVGGDSK